MKLTIEQPALVSALKSAKDAAPSKTTLPSLKCVLIDALDALTFTATNMDQQVTIRGDATITEQGSSLVPIDPAFTAVSRMPKGALITVETDEGGITFKSGRTNVRIATGEPENFPHIASDVYDVSFSVESHVARLMFDKVQFAMANEETRYQLNGVYLHSVDGDIVTVATDGHRLAKWKFKHVGDTPPGVIVPRDTIRLITPPDGSTVLISVSDTKIKFEADGWSLVSKVVDATYPDYTRIIPEASGNSAMFSAKDMSQSIAVTEAVQEAKGNGVLMAISEAGIEVSAKTQTGAVVGVVEADVSGPEQNIGINSKYLNGLMSELDGDCVMDYRKPTDPVVFRDSGDPDWICVVMPMRV